MYIQLYIKRREAGLTIREIAQKHLNISSQSYSSKEKGVYEFTLREAKTLATLFNCTLDELFSEQLTDAS